MWNSLGQSVNRSITTTTTAKNKIDIWYLVMKIVDKVKRKKHWQFTIIIYHCQYEEIESKKYKKKINLVCLVRSSRYITQKEITKNDQLEHRSILSMIESIIKIVKKRKIKNKSRTNKQEQQQQQQKVGVVNKCRFGFWLLSLFLFISFMVHETQQKKRMRKTKRIMESKERIT